MDVPAIENGFKYRSNGQVKILNGCCKCLNSTGKISNE